MYGLQTILLSKIETKKLDGFNARCIQKLIGVAPAFYSHISNNDWGDTNPGTDNQHITFSKNF